MKTTRKKIGSHPRRLTFLGRYRIEKPGDEWHGQVAVCHCTTPCRYPNGRVDYDLQLRPHTNSRGFLLTELVPVK